MSGEQVSQLGFGGLGVEIANEDIRHTPPLVASTHESCKNEKAISVEIAFFKSAGLDRLHVLSLPALGSLGDAELHRLALLQASETTCLDGREMHENVFAILTADKAVALGVIEPLYCSLFHVNVYSFSLM
jgi:hypothetical protein